MSNSYILIQGATVLSMEPPEGKPLYNYDIVIENDRIKAVGRGLSVPSGNNVSMIDAKDCIITPGFVDGHHHMWQHLLRGITADWSLFGYACHLRSVYGSLYTPLDVYFANYAAALSLLNNGVTTVMDHCHVINSPAHADAAVRGLKDAAIRGTFCYGLYQNPKEPGNPASTATDTFDQTARVDDALRVRQEYFLNNDPDTSLLTFGIALNDPPTISREQNIQELDIARKLQARLTTVHTSVVPHKTPKAEVVQNIADANLMGSDLVFSHGGGMTDNELAAVRSSGAGIVGTPDTELQMGMGYPVRDVRRKTVDALRMATLGGAEVMNMGSLVGSIVPGKKADLVIFRCDDIDTVPVVDPIATVVFHASPKNIDTVIVDGKIVKQNGQLVGVDWETLHDQMICRSRRLTDEAAKVDMDKAESLFHSIFEKAMEK
ncbi:unnamed protein product [Penicillium crustosum]